MEKSPAYNRFLIVILMKGTLPGVPKMPFMDMCYYLPKEAFLGTPSKGPSSPH